MLGGALVWARYHHHHLTLGRSDAVDAVRTICLDGRATPCDPEKDPGQGWVQGFFKRHPELLTRSSRIFKVNQVPADVEGRLWGFY